MLEDFTGDAGSMTNDTLDSITRMLTSLPAQLVAGGALAGIVWKFFERVETVLTKDTKLEIAVWLLDLKVGRQVERWPAAFTKVFDRVFGRKHLSWSCFARSCVASYSVVIIAALVAFILEGTIRASLQSWTQSMRFVLVYGLLGNVLPDYVSLLETRFVLGKMSTSKSMTPVLLWLLVDLLITGAIALLATVVAVGGMVAARDSDQSFVAGFVEFAHDVIHSSPDIIAPLVFKNPRGVLWFYPAFFTSVWVWLYAGSGLLLKAACRFDAAFDWFNRRVDIEERPLQAIGLVAGTLVAIIWFAVMALRNFTS